MEFEAKVLSVIDGDTFEIDKTYKDIDIVRIADIDAPEKGESGYEEAKQKLASLILDKIVLIKVKSLDDYGRIVADVFINGKNVADLMKDFK